MTAGRKKIPDQVKILRGTDQPCRMNDEKPIYERVVKVPPSPKFLSKTGKKVWRTVTAQLIAMNLLNVVNVDLVAAYCNELAVYVDLTMELAVEGFTVNTQRGRQINPKRKIATEALANAHRLSSEFGFTPASQSKIVAPLLGKKKDEFDEAFE